MNEMRTHLILFLIGLLCFNQVSCVGKNNDNKEMNKLLRKLELKSKDYPLPKNAIELKLEFSFPSKDLEDEDIYLTRPRNIAKDSSGNIYVTDSRRNDVLKFDSSGQFARKLGRRGQGPGEFERPSSITVTKDFIIVLDVSMRIQFLDLEGRYVKSFKIFKSYGFSPPILNDDGLVFGAPLLRSYESNLIEVLSPEGKLLYSFGKPLEFKYDYQTLNEVNLTVNKKGELFVAFEFLPIVHKYSQKGELLAEYRIDNKIMRTKEKLNLKMNSYRPQKKNVPYTRTISAIDVVDDELYIVYSVPRLEIIVIDREGKIKSTYWWENVEEYYANRILVQNIGNQKKFYLLRPFGAKIDVFVYKNMIRKKGSD